MYSVSDAYKAQIKEPGNKMRAYGTFGSYSFSESNIVEGSFSITNQCSDDTSIKIGQVYVGQLDIILSGIDVDRYTARGMKIIPYCGLLIGNDYEDIPLGVYTVDSAERDARGLKITAYDNMMIFDKQFTVTVASGTPYDLAKLACETCGVTLGTTQQEFSTFANASEQLAMYTEFNDISTWRDFISWVSSACGCFCTIGRKGELLFKAYGNEIVDTLPPANRFQGASFSDYVTKYTGLYVTNSADNTLAYYNLGTDDGLVYELGANPFLQYGTEPTKERIRMAVLTQLSKINYVPFKADVKCNPMYDLGDVLSLPDGLGDSEKLFCITKFEWKYHGKMTLTGVGENPRLKDAKTQNQKMLDGLASKMSSDFIHYYDFVNSENIVIEDGHTKDIINLDYTTTKDTHIDFHAELKMGIDSTEVETDDTWTEHDVTGIITYYIGDELIGYYPITQETDGQKLRHLLYTWQSSANVISSFRATLTASGGDIYIPMGQLHAYWAGQGLVGDVIDTNPNGYDEVGRLTFDLFNAFVDEATADVQTPLGDSTTADTVSRIVFTTMLRSFTDMGETMLGMVLKTYLNTDYYTSNVPTSGQTWVANADNQYIETADMQNVQRIYCTDGGALSYQISFDGGQTWKGYSDTNVWVDDLTMTYETLASLTSAEYGTGKIRLKAIFDNGEKLTGINIVGSELPHKNAVLTMVFGEDLKGQTWTVQDASGSEKHTGTVDDTLTVTAELEKLGTVYTVNVGTYMTERITTDREITAETYDFNFIPAILTLHFGEDTVGKTWMVTDGANEVYTGTVDDTLTHIVKLYQKNKVYTVTCGENTRSLLTNDHYNGDEFSAYLGMFHGEYTVDTPDSINGFELDDEGYYTSRNHNDGGYSIATLNINCTDDAVMTLSCISYGESGYDFGLIGNVGQKLSENANVDSNVYKNFNGQSSSNPQTITMNVPSGTSTVMLKWRKDGSSRAGTDNFRFKVDGFEKVEE